ncbi:hypothetical protein M0R88_03180 [Halorussus gelatinilyticus]|uniref:DUF7979 domain-containing protein n=1 Tax=Halorussus gelatinilyticus TaxID=2937524 RepID=A0A8U0ILA0_9EURY|nr:hypothetical protein [Halorussus gelatinilyticus]UPW01112.1 hypothetical protein M0R88_03180 [Halorussus gelatinilyticus]
MSSNTISGTDSDGRTVRVRPATALPADTPVRHYDELSEEVQQLLAEHDGGGSVAVTPEVAAELADEPVVVFSEYLRVELA